MFTKSFWQDALERAVKTAAQSALLFIGADQLNVLTLDWVTLGGFTAGGAVLSILFSLGSKPLGDASNASLVSIPDGEGRHRA